jgi:hypothetical protein
VVLYEDELADNGVSLLTAKVVGGQPLFMLLNFTTSSKLFNSSFLSSQWDFHWELVPYDFPLVVLHTISIISFHLWCMLGGSF